MPSGGMIHAKFHGDGIKKLFGEEGYIYIQTDRQTERHTYIYTHTKVISLSPLFSIRKVG
jgi:hypothetical protein